MTTTLPAPSELDNKGRARIGDNLWYVHPATGEMFVSVTSITDGLGDDMLGDFWKPEQAARAALEHLPKLIRASRLKPCEKTPRGWRSTPLCQSGEDGHDSRIRCEECPCYECGPCVQLWLRDEHRRIAKEAAGRGSEVHNWIEQWILNSGQEIDIAEQYLPYTRAFLRFVKDYGLSPESWEMAEAKVINRSHGWGGTLDGAIRFDATATKAARELCERFGLARPLLVNDWQTREKEEAKFYGSKAMQVGTYRRAEFLMLPDGTELPMPETDGGIVVQLHLDDYDVRPVVAEDDDYERGFLTLLTNKRWSLVRLPALASVWHHERDEYGRSKVDADGKPVRVTTFPKREIPGLAPAKLPPPAKKAAPRKTTPGPGIVGTPEANEAAREQLIREGVIPDPAKATARKRTAAASKPARGRAAKAAPVQPALPDESGKEFAVVAATSGRRAPHPDSPYGDDIPF